MSPYVYVVLFFAGLAAGIINITAGGGSMLTLPALIFAGVPPVAANATNRIGIIFQNITGIWRFRKGGVHEDHLSWRLIVAGLVGTVIGARLASLMHDKDFKFVFGLLMPILLILILKKPKPKLVKEGAPENAWSGLTRGRKWAVMATFFVLGIYSGFLQAGVGIMILVALGYLVEMDLVRGNYVKLVFTLGLMFVALATFYLSGVKIEWVAGLAVTAGQVTGAYIGVWVAIEKGERWIIVILIVAVLLSSAKLLGILDWAVALLRHAL